MIYLILTVILVLFLIGFSSMADIRMGDESNKQLINSALLLTIITAAEALTIVCGLWFNSRAVLFIARVMYCMLAWLSISLSLWIMRFPNGTKGALFSFLQVVFEILAIYILFYRVSDIQLALETGFVVNSEQVEFLPLSWYQFYIGIYAIVLPGLAFLSMLLRFESVKNRLIRQQMTVILIVLAAGAFALYATCKMTDEVAPAFDLLFPFVLALVIFLIFWNVSRGVLVDFKVIRDSAVSIFFNYIIVSIIAGVLFALLQPLRRSNFNVFLSVYVLMTGALLVLSYQESKFMKKLQGSRDTNYSSHFEEQLASIDFTDGLEDIEKKLEDIFKENVQTLGLDLLIESGETELVTLYSSSGKKTRIPLEGLIFNTALNAQQHVIFRTHAENTHALAPARDELLALFNSTGSEGLVILNEGRRVFGAILLGQKRLGNAYTDYDFEVFNRLYSHFFLIGYYLKNIANESVVGTVNREIQMSGQIIQSIQENMDFITNPKVDVGYLAVAAHNLGGEYLDFIRLSENRHMIILGDMSGKGINASMSTVILKSIVRTFLSETSDFKQLVQKVNGFIRNNLPKGTFFAGVFALVDFSENTMYYINCGIPALFLYNHAYNNTIEIQGEGRVLGFVRNIEKLVKVKKVTMNPGDILLACTNGLLSSKSIRGDVFGKDRVQKSIIENLGFPASKMVQFLHKELLDFISRELDDDVCIVAMKCISK